MLRCSVCGDELTDEMNFCPGCGVAAKGKEVSADGKEKNSGAGDSGQTKNKGSKTDKNSGSKEPKVQVNVISTTKLFYIVFTLILIGGLLIYSSGVFDSPQVSATAQQNAGNNPHAGVDLNNLEQINSLQTTVDQNPDDKESLLQLAHLYNDSGMKEKAIERYIQYLKKDPKNPDVLVDMGVCYYETGKNIEAISAMEKALKINPRHQIANLNLGIVNMSAGNLEKSKIYWKAAIEINPTNEIGQKAKELLTTH